mmetsp:Transcript_44386/g.100259  ORF Transcript_44386/g.100259 Transcript_44386/m.100259 type:complete len:145 (+) Transcript_44386:392-826(+)
MRSLSQQHIMINVVFSWEPESPAASYFMRQNRELPPKVDLLAVCRLVRAATAQGLQGCKVELMATATASESLLICAPSLPPFATTHHSVIPRDLFNEHVACRALLDIGRQLQGRTGRCTDLSRQPSRQPLVAGELLRVLRTRDV